VIGEGEKFPSAFIVPSFAFVKEWAQRKGIDLGDGNNHSLVKDNHVIGRIQQEIDEFNKEFGNWEQIKKFVLLDKEFSIEAEELTPTLKLKRKKILERYQKEYASIYA
jgi:long-chain acyl-CoA synthetase